jgi:outer membrane immunogenic protein
MKKSLIIVAAAAAILAAPAMAADLPVKAPAYTPAVVAPSYNWSGWYIGGNAGYGWLNNETAEIFPGSGTGNLFTFPAFPPATAQSSTISFSGSGGFGGFQAGYNYQLQSNWLVGVETDLQAASIKGSANGTIRTVFSDPFFGLPDWSTTAGTNIRWFGTMRARVGFLPTDNLLLYATGGFAYGQVERTANVSSTFAPPGNTSAGGTFNCANSSACFLETERHTQTGWAAGVGAERAFWRSATMNASLKVEYLHVDLGGRTLFIPATQPPGVATMIASYSAARFDMVRIGLNFKLN